MFTKHPPDGWAVSKPETSLLILENTFSIPFLLKAIPPQIKIIKSLCHVYIVDIIRFRIYINSAGPENSSKERMNKSMEYMRY